MHYRNHVNTLVSIKALIKVVGFLFVFFSISLVSSVVQAQEEEQTLSLKQILLMPGKLTQGHAKIESKCQSCHLHFDKSNQSPLCVECHEEIKEDLDTSTGFHSNIPQKEIKECRGCHTDHKGREFDITGLDQDYFDHSLTEFGLKGSHQSIDCVDCHKESEKNFRMTLKSGQCRSCHEDPHKEKFKNDCSECHDEKSWQVEEFDHSETDFLLKDKHSDLSCQSCHVNDVSVEIGNECVNCHLSKDKHLNVFGSKCQSCHSEKGWDKVNYDHFKETEFELLGKHKKLSCQECHSYTDKPKNTSSTAKKKHYENLTGIAPGTTCNDCHQKDDIHLGSNGDDCKQCHNNKSWEKTSFDHDEETNFLLQGAHKELNCSACHLPSDEKNNQLSEELTPKSEVRMCNDCHQLADPHMGKLGEKCQSCHQQEKWHKDVTFSHEFTKFPLLGAHQMQVCQACHFSTDFTVDSFTCIDCHSNDDFHEQTLGEKCSQCHNSSSWTSWQFDHQTQTDFPLEGSHNSLECNLCHTKDLPDPLLPMKTCISCHKNDDAHQGTFGQNCQQCHNTDSFYDFKH